MISGTSALMLLHLMFLFPVQIDYLIHTGSWERSLSGYLKLSILYNGLVSSCKLHIHPAVFRPWASPFKLELVISKKIMSLIEGVNDLLSYSFSISNRNQQAYPRPETMKR